MKRPRVSKNEMWISAADAVDMTGLYSQRTFLRWAQSGKITAQQLPNGRWLIWKPDVEALTAPPSSEDVSHSEGVRDRSGAVPFVDPGQLVLPGLAGVGV